MSRTTSGIVVQRLLRRLDDDVHAVAEHVELGVGDEGGDLDQGVVPEVETGHLAVDPDHLVVAFGHGGHPRGRGAAAHRHRLFTLA